LKNYRSYLLLLVSDCFEIHLTLFGQPNRFVKVKNKDMMPLQESLLSKRHPDFFARGVTSQVYFGLLPAI